MARPRRPAPAVPPEIPGRRARLGNGYIGRRQAADGFVLREGLPGPGRIGLDDAVRLVVEDWHRQEREGRLASGTPVQYGRRAAELVAFVRRDGATELADVDEETAEAYVWCTNAPGTRRPGEEPRLDTLIARRSAVRAVFGTARALGLDDRLVGARIVLPARTSEEHLHDPADPSTSAPAARALSDGEADRCRDASRYRLRDTRLPAAAACALAGADTGEMPGLLVAHARLRPGALWCPGAGRSHGRWLPLDEWEADEIARHVGYLARRVPSGDLPATPLLYVGPTRQRRDPARRPVDPRNSSQSEMTALLRRVLRKAGLGDDLCLVPRSFQMRAGARAFRREGRVEDAAVVMGIADLNTAAGIVGYDWRNARALWPPPEQDTAG